MPFAVSEHGGLAVAFSPADEKAVARALQRLDPNLFLDPELEPYGPRGPYVYMTVKEHVGSNHPPVPILEWRDVDGPKPLSMGIVEAVRRREGQAQRAVQQAIEANRKLRERAIELVGEGAFDVARAGGMSVSGRRSVMLPRGQWLRMSRDRARTRGEKR